jgi:hypothetical protein
MELFKYLRTNNIGKLIKDELWIKEKHLFKKLFIPKYNFYKFNKIKRNKKRPGNIMYSVDDLNIYIKNIQHPHLYDLQQECNFNIKYKNYHEIKLLSKITKEVGYDGIYQYRYFTPDNKQYRLDYVYTLDDKPFIIIEIDENHHNRINNIAGDNIRNAELEYTFTNNFYNIPFDINDDELNSIIQEIKLLKEYSNDELSINKMEKEFNEFTEIEAFAKKYGNKIISCQNDEDNKTKFIFDLDLVKDDLQILTNPELNKRIDSYFADDIDISVNELTESFSNTNLDSSDSDEWDDSDSESDSDLDKIKPEISNNNNIKLFEINKDFILQKNKIFITRETFINIAIKSDSIVGIQIFHQIMKFEDMIKKFIEISKKRRVMITHLINESRLKRVYHKRLSLPLTKENRQLRCKVKRLEKIINLNTFDN